MSPLHYACQRRHALLLPLLLQQSAFVNAKDSVDERSPLHYATDHYAPSAAMVYIFFSTFLFSQLLIFCNLFKGREYGKCTPFRVLEARGLRLMHGI
jgi:hypothetical protein